jgi:dTDP-4-dehydrorhamnose 3,5-epimerase
MKMTALKISDVKLIETEIFEDDRGLFFESFNQEKFNKAIGHSFSFVQDNQSTSKKGVIRGLHYQKEPFAQGKLVRAVKGEIFDVAVDIRKLSPTFGQHISYLLSEENNKQIWVPPGFAHGFLVISDEAIVQYSVTEFYSPANEGCIIWNDPFLNIQWPKQKKIILSKKDLAGKVFKDVDFFYGDYDEQ